MALSHRPKNSHGHRNRATRSTFGIVSDDAFGKPGEHCKPPYFERLEYRTEPRLARGNDKPGTARVRENVCRMAPFR